MPRRRSDIPLEKVTIMLYAGDMAEMIRLYPGVGASAIIRVLVRKHLNSKRGFERKPIPVVDLEELQ